MLSNYKMPRQVVFFFMPGCVDRIITRPQEILQFHPDTLIEEIYITTYSKSCGEITVPHT